MMRQLVVLIDDQRVGLLEEENGLWAFQYDTQWLASGKAFGLCPSLPLQAERHRDDGTLRPVQWYFDNLVPEEEQRVLLAADANVSPADAFGLLAHFGAESAGSLTLRSPDSTQEPEASMRPLTYARLMGRIEKLPRVPLTRRAPKKMSLAGAQHKLAVVYRGGKLFEPVGAVASTHILKPDHPATDDYPHSVINEWFVMSLARELGIRVAPVHRLYVPAPIYLVERFDREAAPEDRPAPIIARRLHAIDACQALGIDRAFKYSHASVARLLEIADLCRVKPAARLALFSWLAFNVLAGNGDTHLKNISLMAGRDGFSIAPAYDLLSTAVYATKALGGAGWPDVPLAWPILEARTFAEMARARLVQAGGALRLSRETSERVVARMREQIDPACQRIIARVDGENAEQLQSATPDRRRLLAAIFAGEQRCLRAIRTIVVRDMCKRIA